MGKNIKTSDKISFGLTGNNLKLVAVICMIIDHIGYFFANKYLMRCMLYVDL